MSDVRIPQVNTSLGPLDEMAFRQWLGQKDVPFNPEAAATDYDMRGYWQGLQQDNPASRPTAIDPYDNRPHFTDYWKNPSHETFSNESRLAGPGAPDPFTAMVRALQGSGNAQ